MVSLPHSSEEDFLGTLAGSDIVVPFQIENRAIRGRLVRLGASVDAVLSAHAYPDLVSRLLGEALALTALLGTALKFDGIFTLQAQGNGAVSLLVADYETNGAMRGYASFNADAIALLGPSPSLVDLLGKGALALTIDPKLGRDRYQGIVPLEGATLSDAARLYFDQSEQIPTRIILSVARRFAPDAAHGEWRAGGLMVQVIPVEGGQSQFASSAAEDDWTRTSLLAQTVAADELVDPMLSADRLLYRLFHEDGVRVFAPNLVRFGCRCSGERLSGILMSYPQSDLEAMSEAGQIAARCEFCSRSYSYSLDALLAQRAAKIA